MSAPVRTTCPYCGVGCGLIAEIVGGAPRLRGDSEHPANFGALCSKGAALGETMGLQHRLLQPRVAGTAVSWDTALDAVAQGFQRVIDEHGPDAVAFYVSGQLLTEDYYVANKLMKGFIGSANIDTNSRLCMASAVAAHKRAFGEDLVPVSYEDLEQTDLVVLVGANSAWCHPVLHQRILAARERRPGQRLIVIDPRRTPTAEGADLHLPVRAGTDVLLFNGLLTWLAREGHIDTHFVREHTTDADRALLVAENTSGDLAAVARGCGLELHALQQFFEWFAHHERVVTAFSQGVNQSSAGTDKANAIINVHLLTGRIGRPGMGPFSLTGQPNAMGGREVGGLANMLAAHMELDCAEHRTIVQRFWQAPRLAQRSGLKAVDLFEAIYKRQIKAVWIMATNPIVSLPNADRAREALRRCELVVVSDCVADTDTTKLAHVLLPAAAWGEKDGTVTNSERRISRQRGFLSRPGQTMPDWWIICEVAKRLGFEGSFTYESAGEIFDEHARLSAEAGESGRAFDLAGLVGLGAGGYEELAPIQWPVPRPRTEGVGRLFADGQFRHPDGRARLVPVRPQPPRYARDEEYPLILNTGRVRDQWHTMTRTGLSPRLLAHLPEPFVDMHSADALAFGLRDDTLVRVVTRWGRLVARLRTSGEIARGSIFVPIHWSNATASDARVGALCNPAVDPLSGEPEFKYTPVRVEPFVVSWYGFVLSRRAFALTSVEWWSGAGDAPFVHYEIAGRRVPGDWSGWARALLSAEPTADWIDYCDASAGTYRAALLQNERLESCVFIAARPHLPSRAWLTSLFEKEALTPSERAAVLAGGPRGVSADTGSAICACFNVGRDAIESVIADGCRDVAALGQRLKAGTNCGSCLPELRRMIAAAAESANA